MQQVSVAEARRLCGVPQSGLFLVTAEEGISLPPRYQNDVASAVNQHLDAMVGFVCDKFEGAVMGYSNIRLLGDKGRIIDDSPFIVVRVRVDFVVFQPRVGATLRGEFNKMGKDHMGGVVHGLFNVSILLKQDADGNIRQDFRTALTKGDHFSFVVICVHKYRGLMSMAGKMLR